MQPHGLQHVSFLCPLLAPEVCSNSCPLSQWCYLTISSSATNFFCLQSFPVSQLLASGDQKYWSFSFSICPSSEYSGLISFRIDWFYLAVQGTLKSPFQHHNSKVLILLALSLLYDPTFTSIHDHWKNHGFDDVDLCRQSDVSAFYYTA